MDGPLESTPVYHRVRDLLDEWHKYAEDLGQKQLTLNYTKDKQSTSRKLLHDMLDQKLSNLAVAQRQFKAPRSMRDVEPNVALLPRWFNQTEGAVRIKGVKTTVSSLRQSQLVTTYGPGSMIDLPWFAAVIGGLDFWDRGVAIPEPRLEAKARAVLGIDHIALAAPVILDKPPDGSTKRGVVTWRSPAGARPGIRSRGETETVGRISRGGWSPRSTSI